MAEGQIRKALSGYYYVYQNGELIQCRGRGVFRNRGESPCRRLCRLYKRRGIGWLHNENSSENERISTPLLLTLIKQF